MEEYEIARWVYRAVLAAAALASWAVVAVYQHRSHGLWRTSTWGRHIIGSDTLLAVILTFYLFASFMPRWLVWLGGIVLLSAYIWYRIKRARLMLQSQDKGEQKDRALQREEAR